MTKLRVAKANDLSIDEHLYAIVNDLKIRNGHLILKGKNPSSCFELDEVEIFNNEKNTYSILPKLKRVRSFCPRVLDSFTYKVRFKNVLNTRKVLFHVRKMNGKAFNKLHRYL
jgi:hypothetical protein